MTMATDLIVDFPHQCKSRKVHFSETSQLHIYSCPKVARHKLWYTKSDYALMALAISEDVLKLRVTGALKVGVDDYMSNKIDVSLMGIEHLLSPLFKKEVETCRARCIQAVLMEQAEVGGVSARFGWERIALASIDETKKARERARKLGKLHQCSVG